MTKKETRQRTVEIEEEEETVSGWTLRGEDEYLGSGLGVKP